MRQPSKSAIYTVIAALAVMLIAACGAAGDYGAYGSWGSELTNMQVSASLVPGTLDVDICDPSSVDVSADITAEQIVPDIPTGSLSLQGYTVRFSTSASGVYVPAEATYSVSGALPVAGTKFMFIGPNIKAAVVNSLNSGAYIASSAYPTYTVEYTIYGTDMSRIDRLWGIKEAFSFRMGRYSFCPLVVTASTASVSAIANPDTDPSDDIIVDISGGRPPYTFTSDSLLITAPSTMTTHGSTILEPTVSLSPPEMVTVTVMDADGQVVALPITIN